MAAREAGIVLLAHGSRHFLPSAVTERIVPAPTLTRVPGDGTPLAAFGGRVMTALLLGDAGHAVLVRGERRNRGAERGRGRAHGVFRACGGRRHHAGGRARSAPGCRAASGARTGRGRPPVSLVDLVLDRVRDSLLGGAAEPSEQRTTLDDALLLRAQDSAEKSAEAALGASQAVGAAAAQQKSALDAATDRARLLHARGKDAEGSVARARDALERAKLVALNSGLEGSRLGEAKGRALGVGGGGSSRDRAHGAGELDGAGGHPGSARPGARSLWITIWEPHVSGRRTCRRSCFGSRPRKGTRRAVWASWAACCAPRPVRIPKPPGS